MIDGGTAGVAAKSRRKLRVLVGISLVVPLFVALLVLSFLVGGGGRPEEPYVQDPIPLAEFAGNPRAVSGDGFDVMGGFSCTFLLGFETRAEIECLIESRNQGYRMKLELHRRVDGEWRLVTGTEEIEGVPGFGIRHDVRGEDPDTVFKVEGHWFGGSAGRVVRSREIGIGRPFY